jgi:hypothetical protein
VLSCEIAERGKKYTNQANQAETTKTNKTNKTNENEERPSGDLPGCMPGFFVA